MQVNLPHFALTGGAALILAAGAYAQNGSVVTLLDGGNSQDGSMFDLTSTCSLTVTGFDVYFQSLNNPPPCGTTCSVNEVELYSNSLGWKGNTMNPGVWTLEGSVQHTIAYGPRIPQPLNIPVSLTLPGGTAKKGIYVTNTGPTNSITGLPNELINYTNGTTGAVVTNGELDIVTGTGNEYPFGANFKPRLYNGVVHYTQNAGCTACVANATNYCTAGFSASGCQATLSAVGTPSPTRGEGFIIYTTGFEGSKVGIFFYGQAGQQASPWGNSSSFQCVTPPVKRTPARKAKGSNDNCDGWAQKDLNEVWCPTCPKAAPVVGTKMQIQFWYRDPQSTSNQTTALSDGMEVDICP